MPTSIDRLTPRLMLALTDPKGQHYFTTTEADMLCSFIRVRIRDKAPLAKPSPSVL